MRLSVIVALLCIGLTMAQWPCQSWGFNGPIPNCASCQYYGSAWSQTYVMAQDPVGNVLPYSVCTTCTTGFYLQQSLCQPCPPGCNWCNSNGACNPNSCGTGYTWNPVLSNCMACPAALNCTSCAFNPVYQSSLFPSSQASNFQPISGWFNPSTTQINSVRNGPYVCTQCGSLQYISTTGACTACPANAASCSMGAVTTLASSGYLSITCVSGYYANGIVCTACPSNAIQCPGGVVSVCATGYYDNAGTCTACNSNCRQCNTAGPACDLTGCATGYVADATGNCIAATAITGCLYWDGTGAVTNLCSQCMAGYVLAANGLSCIACSNNCTTCWLDSTAGVATCTQCQANFTLVATYLQAISGTNTQTANSVMGGTCLPLPANCLAGQPASSSATVATCLQCYPGYGLVVNITTNATSCQQCPPGCLACDGLGVCTQCNITTVLVPNQCLQCPYNCSVCANATYCYNNCTKNYNYNAATGQCLPNGTERLIMAGFALISLFLYFL